MAALANTPWPMFQHDQRHTGQSPYLGTQTNTVRWSYSTGYLIRGSAAIGSDGTIYLNSYDYICKLYAFNPDGSIKWAKDTDSVDGAPAIGSDGTIYIAGIYGLYAYTPDGTRKWFCSAQALNGSPVIGNDGTIYCGQSGAGGDGLLYAFKDNGSSGSVKWTYLTGQLLHTAPAIGNDGTIYIGSVYNTLYALTDDGNLKWSFQDPGSGSLASSPPSIGADGTIYIGSYSGWVYAITDNETNAFRKWRYNTGGWVQTAPAIGSNGTIYVGCRGGSYMLFALNPAGSPRWSYGSGDIASSSPVIGNDGTIYIGDVYGKIYAVFDDKVQNTAVLKWQYQAGDSIYGSAAIGSDGTVYIGSYDSKFYAFNSRPLITSVNPNSGKQGQILNNVIITGTQLSGATAVSFGTGISTNSYTVDNATQIRANLTISAGATTGLRDVSVTTSGGTGTLTGAFTVLAAPAGPLTASVNTGLGTVNFTTSSGSISGLVNLPPDNMPCSSGGYIFPYGMFSFSITNLGPGATTTVTITTPTAVPMGSRVFKCQNGSLTDFSQYVRQPDPNTFILTLRDGGQGDADGVANGTIVDPCGMAYGDTGPHQSSSAQIPTTAQGPAPISNVAAQSASISTAKVAPGAPVTVTANVVNNGTANGSSQIKLYVNGQEEAHQGVTLSSGSRASVKFTVSRDEPGTYSVYVGSIPAGAFEVDQFADPNTILYVSMALILGATVLGIIYIRRQRPN